MTEDEVKEEIMKVIKEAYIDEHVINTMKKYI